MQWLKWRWFWSYVSNADLNIRRYEITTRTPDNGREMYHLKAFRLYENPDELFRSNVCIMAETLYEPTNCIPPSGLRFGFIKDTRPVEWVTPPANIGVA